MIFTPPYHPGLQEIEIIWACAKQYCKKNPANSFKQLKVSIVPGPKSIVTEKTWKGVHKKVRNFEDIYLAEMASDPLIKLGSLTGVWGDEYVAEGKILV